MKIKLFLLLMLLSLPGCLISDGNSTSDLKLDEFEQSKYYANVALAVALCEKPDDDNIQTTCEICNGTKKSGDGLGPCPCGKNCKCKKPDDDGDDDGDDDDGDDDDDDDDDERDWRCACDSRRTYCNCKNVYDKCSCSKSSAMSSLSVFDMFDIMMERLQMYVGD